jgi:hypothetical protein
MLTTTAALAFAATLSFVSPQAPISELSSNYADDLGWVLHNVGDLDGDGRDDLAAAYPGFALSDRSRSELQIYSWTPREQRWLAEWSVAHSRSGQSSKPNGGTGESLTVLRHAGASFEFAVGAPGTRFDGKGGGAVETFAALGRQGQRIAWSSDDVGEEFGAALAALPDLDEDGRAELAIGAPGRDRVVLVSTTDRGVLGELRGNSGAARFGAAIALLGKGGNGWNDTRIVIGAPEESTAGERRGALHVHRLNDGRALRSIHGTKDGERFGARLVVGDLGGDSARELVVASLGSQRTNASICVLDTISWQRSWTHELGAAAAANGLRIDTIADLDGDSWGEVLVSFEPENPELWPEALVLSGRDGNVMHTIRSYAPERGSTGRVMWPGTDGVRLGAHVGFIGAGDQDGDGIEDVWLAIRSEDGYRSMFSSISLISGAKLNGKLPERSLHTVPRILGLASVSSDPSTAPSIAIADLPKHFVHSTGDLLDADARGGVCSDSALGKRVDTLGDLDCDGRDEVWVAGIGHAWDAYHSYLLKSANGAVLKAFADGDFHGAARVEDLDGDGRDDLALGASERTYRFCEMVGRVQFCSSASGKMLREIKHPGGAYEFGASVVAVGDVDGDGVFDLAIGTPATAGWGFPDPKQQAQTCEVALVSGGSASTFLRTLRGDATGADGFGRTLAFGGDWNGDGVPDLAVGAPLDGSAALNAGAVHVYCGATWQRLEHFASDIPGERLGQRLAWSRDLDGDGRAELIATAPWCGADQRGRVVVLSSKRRSTLYELVGRAAQDAFGFGLALGDLDGDGADELVVGAPGAWREGPWHSASVSIFAAATGRELARIAGEPYGPVHFEEGVEWTSRIGPYSYFEPALPRFGFALAIARDLDGDGIGDLCIGSPSYRGPAYAGSVYALSGAELRKHWK